MDELRYQAMRAVRDKSLHVICYEDKFEQLPDEVRHREPWQGLKRGNVEALKADHRIAFARDDYVIVQQSVGVFAPEHS
jgi:hypothetical protein